MNRSLKIRGYCIDAVSIGLQHVKAGRLRALAYTGPARLPILPEVAALNETLSGLVALNWYGMMLPAGAPREVVTRLHAEIAAALNNTDVRHKLAGLGFDAVGSAPREFTAFRNAQESHWARVVKEANIKSE